MAENISEHKAIEPIEKFVIFFLTVFFASNATQCLETRWGAAQKKSLISIIENEVVFFNKYEKKWDCDLKLLQGEWSSLNMVIIFVAPA